jgi:hypothetical protein
MSDEQRPRTVIPILTDVVGERVAANENPDPRLIDDASLIAELQTRISADAYELTQQVLHSAFAEIQASAFEQVSTRLRKELPELIDRILREYLDDATEGD